MKQEVEYWLLEKENPSIRYRTVTELLDKSRDLRHKHLCMILSRGYVLLQRSS